MTDPEQTQQKVRVFGHHAEESWKGTKIDNKVVLMASADAPQESPSDSAVVIASKAHTSKASTPPASPE